MTDPTAPAAARAIAFTSRDRDATGAIISLADQLDLYKQAEKLLDDHGIVLWQKEDGKTLDGFGFSNFKPWIKACTERNAALSQLDAMTKDRDRHIVMREKMIAKRDAALARCGETETETEIGEFQDTMRDALVDFLGKHGAKDPGKIDGGGCDSGDWRDFSHSELDQGLGMIEEEIIDPLRAKLAAAEGALRKAIALIEIPAGCHAVDTGFTGTPRYSAGLRKHHQECAALLPILKAALEGKV